MFFSCSVFVWLWYQGNNGIIKKVLRSGYSFSMLNKYLRSNKQKQKEFMTIKPALQKKLNGILHTEQEDKCNQENTVNNKYH
jgi:hypothetical protein